MRFKSFSLIVVALAVVVGLVYFNSQNNTAESVPVPPANPKQISPTQVSADMTLPVTGQELQEHGEFVNEGLKLKKQRVDSQAPCRFAVIGDAGSGSVHQYNVAKQMASFYTKAPFNQVLMLGDNIYPDGNIKKEAVKAFEKPYAPLLTAGVGFVVALGNHDTVHGFEGDQIEYFKMPGRYYTKPLCNEVDHGVNVTAVVVDSNILVKDATHQQWLKDTLKQQQAKAKPHWTIVMAHHPVFTSGAHGKDAFTHDLKKVLAPILDEYDVPLYLAGHDHNYERFAPKQNVLHIVSGGGGAWVRKFGNIEAGSLVRHSINHFMVFEGSPTTLYFKAIDENGKTIDKGTLTQ